MMVSALCRHQATSAPATADSKPGWLCSGAAVAEAVDRHIDEARIDRRERLVVQAETAHPARAQIFDHDIRAAHQAVDHLAPLGRSKVERKRALALVPAEKTEAEVAERVALEAFDS